MARATHVLTRRATHPVRWGSGGGLGVLGFLHFAVAQVGVTRCSLIADGPTAPVAADLPWHPAPHFILAFFVSRPLGD